MTYDDWKTTDPRDAYDEWDEDGEQECDHEWEYTGTAYGGDDHRWHGEGRCYCIFCGADGDG